MEVASLINLILNSEDTLMEKTLKYAKDRGYTKYTSTLTEAWRISISGLSATMIKAIQKYGSIPEIGPDDDHAKNEIAEFGMIEAQKHRSRGISLGMFLGLMKYYAQAYTDLVQESNLLPDERQMFSQYIKRYFDHVELGFIMEWTGQSESQKLYELQEQNRNITNEKNKYLTIFESIYDPIILLDKNNNIENLNHRAAEDFLYETGSGKKYYSDLKTDIKLDWLKQVLIEFDSEKGNEIFHEKTIQTKSGSKTYLIKLKKMLDVSEKYSGSVIIFYDMTERLKIEQELFKQNQKLEYYAYTDPMTKVFNRRTGLKTLDTQLALAHNKNTSLSICYFDVDDLKATNDTYGHAEGDHLINFIASTTQIHIRNIDSISRMGGDEFLIIFPDCIEVDANKIVMRIIKKLKAYDKKAIKPYTHSFSYGIVEIPADNNSTANEVIKTVDEKMYRMKLSKKSNVKLI